MKKFAFSLLFVAIALAGFTSSAFAGTTVSSTGPYNGIFIGTVEGDRNSTTEIELNLTQVKNEVKGELVLGEGLYIDGGRCWRGSLPSGSFTAIGSTLPASPNNVEASASFQAGSVTIKGYLAGEISTDGKLITSEVKIDLPWFCGRDPVLLVTAEKES